MNKTLIGKENYLFLVNDSENEIMKHCLPICNNDTHINYINISNYCIVIFPDKSFLYKKYLPDKYCVKYRPCFNKYKNILGNKCIDVYELIKDIPDIYYKSDTHINNYGSYIVYKHFVNYINTLYNLDLNIIHVNLERNIIHVNLKRIDCTIDDLYKEYGTGDLTLTCNLGDQTIENIYDVYYTIDYEELYLKYIIYDNTTLRFLTYELYDDTCILSKKKKLVTWDIISKYILYVPILNKKATIVVFYDSFILWVLKLYIDTFKNSNYEVYFIKNKYDINIINKIRPDYVFEFRIERFLC